MARGWQRVQGISPPRIDPLFLACLGYGSPHSEPAQRDLQLATLWSTQENERECF
jgi:hypothetical protein